MNDPERLREAEDALRDALRVEPSPGLLARVRADAAAARAGRGAAWLGAAAAALVVAAVAGVVVSRSPAVPAPARSAVTRVEANPASGSPAPIAPSAPTRRLPSRAARFARPAAPASAEIIVEPGQAEALVRLVELVASGEMSPPRALLEPDDALASLPLPEPVRIEPLDIAPLNPSTPLAPSPLARGDF